MSDTKAYSPAYFQKKFKPITNHFRPHTTMFETTGEEHDYVVSCEPYRVFTLCEYEGQMLVYPGYHIVNRLGYYILPLTVVETIGNFITNITQEINSVQTI